MTKELIRENIEEIKFKKWQENTRQQVSEQTAMALIRISQIRKELLDARF